MTAPPLAVAFGEMLPHCKHDSDQVTPLCAGSSFTTATIFCTVPPNRTELTGAVTVTEIAFTVITIEVCAEGSATEVATTFTARSADGGAGGAV